MLEDLILYALPDTEENRDLIEKRNRQHSNWKLDFGFEMTALRMVKKASSGHQKIGSKVEGMRVGDPEALKNYYPEAVQGVHDLFWTMNEIIVLTPELADEAKRVAKARNDGKLAKAVGVTVEPRKKINAFFDNHVGDLIVMVTSNDRF